MKKKLKKIYFFVLMIICLLIFTPLIFSGEEPQEKVSTDPEEQNYTPYEAGLHTGENNEENTAKPIEAAGAENSNHHLRAAEEPTLFPSRGKIETWDHTLVETLSFLQSPIPGAKVTSRDSQLPGAARTYRNGYHEGLDFYSGYCDVSVNYGDPVYAAGPGVIYRIDHDYLELPLEEREEALRICHEADDTPEEILDMLRGRQVWIIHSHGIITRYAHLSTTADNLQEGDLVKSGDLIGTVGNSGTNEGAMGSTANAHLHFEIWIGDSYLGEGLPPEEIRTLWGNIINAT